MASFAAPSVIRAAISSRGRNELGRALAEGGNSSLLPMPQEPRAAPICRWFDWQPIRCADSRVARSDGRRMPQSIAITPSEMMSSTIVNARAGDGRRPGAADARQRNTRLP